MNPNGLQLSRGTRWRYMIPGDGGGVIHTVTSVDPVPDTPTPEVIVTTWGDAYRPNGTGDTWYGPLANFLHCFIAAKP